MSTTEAEIKQAKGICTEISEKGDWTTFHIDTGGQWPVKLSTKLEALVVQGREAKNADAVWTYKETEGGDNPHKPGTKFRNRWLSSVEVGGEVTIAPTASPTSTSTASGNAPDVDWDSKERRDFRSRAWAQTIAAFTHTIKTDEKPEAVFLRLQPFQRKVYEDVCGTFAYPEDGGDIPFNPAGQSPLSEHDQSIPFGNGE